MVSLLNQVKVPNRPIAQLEPVIGAKRYERLLAETAKFRKGLGHSKVWNINSTAVGGGVAEMLQAIVGYSDDLDIPIRWGVITGDPEFFATTKRLHNQIHGDPSGGPLTKAEAQHYQEIMAANTVELLEQIRPGDIVLLHDPQTAGLCGPLVQAGIKVVWRCHIGIDEINAAASGAWDFLRPQISMAHRYIFSRQQYLPPGLPAGQAQVIAPSIDPFSPKNQFLDEETVRTILSTIGVITDGPTPAPGRYTRYDGTTAQVSRRAELVCRTLPRVDDPVVLQVSRWDRLKDMIGVMDAFAGRVVPACQRGHLMLVGPSVRDVADDPEGALVYRECLARWQELPEEARDRIMLVTLPLDDIEENAAMVNALQRHAAFIVQKSIAEGFGLTVAEGMWKGKPVVGSAVGGILDQIVPGTGILLPDPHDQDAFGNIVLELLNRPDQVARMGESAHEHIREYYVGDLHLLRYANLLSGLLPTEN